MTVELSADQIEGEIEQRLKKIARNLRLPGFRPGKVPLKILRQRYGGQVLDEVFGERVQSSFAEAVDQEQLRPAGAPHIEVDVDANDKKYAYTAIFEVLPDFELGSLQEVTIKRPVAAVTDADLENMVERLRKQRQTWNTVERPAQQGDRVTTSFQGFVDDAPFEGSAGEHVPVDLGSGRMIEGFESGLVGASAGEHRTLEVRFPDDYQVADLAGKLARFEIEVESVAEPELPEVDEAFAKAFGVTEGSVDRFMQDVRQNMQRELRQRIDAKVKNAVMNSLLQANDIAVPEALVRDEIANLKAQTRQRAGGAGTMELPDELFRDQARRRVALGLVMAEVVKQHSIKADPQRVREVLENVAASYEKPEEVIAYYYGNKEQLASFESVALEDEVVKWVLDRVQVEDEPSSFEELTRPQS
jgi:trigger factor